MRLVPIQFNRLSSSMGSLTVDLHNDTGHVTSINYRYVPDKQTFKLIPTSTLGASCLKYPIAWPETPEEVMQKIVAFDVDHNIDIREA